MAWRLGDFVEWGELLNTRSYSTHGWLKIRGHEQPLRFELTGNPDADLKGWHIRFEARPSDGQAGAEPPAQDFGGLQWRQIGATGDMTAARQVKVPPCPIAEFLKRCQAGEPPPCEWKNSIYLEWFGQNGRVVIELPDPAIEYVDHVELDADAPEDGPQPHDLEEGQPGFSATIIHRDEDGQYHEETVTGDDLEREQAEPDDPYGLFPKELEAQLERQALETDITIQQNKWRSDNEDLSDEMREIILQDELIEHGDGQPLLSFLEDRNEYPPPDGLDDREVETRLKCLLGELALWGVKLDVCEHYTPRDCYRLLLDEILPNETAYRELRGTGWVQHFMTSEFCAQCEAEMDRQFEEEERRRAEQDPRDADGDAGGPSSGPAGGV